VADFLTFRTLMALELEGSLGPVAQTRVESESGLVLQAKVHADDASFGYL
jgi:hypothetical protein